jgi:hypothetical protein
VRPHSGGKEIAVGVIDAVAAQWLPGLDELGPRRHHDHARTRGRGDPSDADGREQADLPRAEHVAAAHQQVALLHLLAGETDVLALLRRAAY